MRVIKASITLLKCCRYRRPCSSDTCPRPGSSLGLRWGSHPEVQRSIHIESLHCSFRTIEWTRPFRRFRKVTFPTEERGGLIGQGSLLAVTSYPNRTSPVLRGKWVLETLLGSPPTPAVPPLPDPGEAGKSASVRQRLEAHRSNPRCAGCHAPMDPLGFALENFDP